jgi:uncharacterized DUF497 family protein
VTFNWDEEKNTELKKRRNISFEEIILCISEGKVVTVMENPNKTRYPNQYLYLIEYKNYIYVVPFEINEDEKEIFLKTIYPSREYTNRFIRGEEENEES